MQRINQIEPSIGDEEKRAVLEYLDSGGWLTEFKRTREFEQMICAHLVRKYASVVSSGTAALYLALLGLGIGKGDEVIVPDLTMIATANAVVAAGATPVLVDISPQDLCLNLDLADEAVSEKTKAIMLVSLNGRYPDMSRAVDICRKHNLYLVEDACQALGSWKSGRQIGTFGEAGCFSFSYPKIVTTGQGGAIVTDNEDLHRRILMAKDFGRPVSGVDHHEVFGLNFKFTDLQAVIGIEQMKKIDSRAKRKREIYRIYRDLMEKFENILLVETDLSETTPWFVDILVERDRDRLAKFLDDRGIGTRPFYPAVHSQTPYRHMDQGQFNNATLVSEAGLWLPSSVDITDSEIETVCKSIEKFFSKRT